MSAIVTSSPANQDRPLLIHPSSQPSNQRRFRTLLDFLIVDKINGQDPTVRRVEENNNNSSNSKWKILKQRLGLKVTKCCCGIATWQFENSSSSSSHEGEGNVVVLEGSTSTRQQEGTTNDVAVGSTTMNLAAALAVEREFRLVESNDDVMMTPSRVSLMRLLEETSSDGCDLDREIRSEGGDEKVNDCMCCVCMGRKKGAAFIPCGHTYCRVCCRELWLNRGSCPLCNRPIHEILDIF